MSYKGWAWKLKSSVPNLYLWMKEKLHSESQESGKKMMEITENYLEGTFSKFVNRSQNSFSDFWLNIRLDRYKAWWTPLNLFIGNIKTIFDNMLMIKINLDALYCLWCLVMLKMHLDVINVYQCSSYHRYNSRLIWM